MEISSAEPAVAVTLAQAEPVAVLLLSSEPRETKASTPKPRRETTKRKAKVTAPENAPLQLNLDA